MDVRSPFSRSDIAVVHVQDVDLLGTFLADEVDFEASVEILVSEVLVVVSVLQLKVLVDRDDSTLHSPHCMNIGFLRICK
jgi:hypothetical protein